MSNGGKLPIEEPAAELDDGPEEESTRRRDPECGAMDRCIKLINALSPDARLYILARLKKAATPNA